MNWNLKEAKPQEMKYLGYGFGVGAKVYQFKVKLHAKSIEKFKKRMKEFTCCSWGVSNSYKVEKLNLSMKSFDKLC